MTYIKIMSFQLTVPVAQYLSGAVMGQRIEIKDEKSDTTQFYRETIYKMSEFYKLIIKYNKKEEEFVLSGSDKDSVTKAYSDLREIVQKKKAEYENYMEREKHRKQQKKEQRFFKKQQELQQKIKYEMQHAHKVQEKPIEKKEVISSKNKFFGLQLPEDEITDKEYEESVRLEKQTNKQRKKLLRRIKYLTENNMTEELYKVQNELASLDGNSDKTEVKQNTDNNTKFNETEFNDTEFNELNNTEYNDMEYNEQTDDTVEQSNNFIKNKEDSYDNNFPRNRGFYQPKDNPKKNGHNEQSDGWTNVCYSNNIKSKDRSNRRNTPHNKQYNTQTNPSNYLIEDNNMSMHIKDKLDELIGDYECDFPPLLNNFK